MNMNMKYALILFAGLTLAASGAFAQEKPARDRLAEIENLNVKPTKHHQTNQEFKKVGLNVLPEIGMGIRAASQQVYKPTKGESTLYYAHLLEAYVRPVSWASFNVGAGLGWGKYQSKESVFGLNDKNELKITPMPEEWVNTRNSRSSLREWMVLLPATLQFHLGDYSLRCGAEALYSFQPKVRLDLRDEEGNRYMTEKDGGIAQRWNYDFFASFSLEGLGLFVKYQPKAFRILSETESIYPCWTFGFLLEM